LTVARQAPAAEDAQVVGMFVTTEATSANASGIGVADFVLSRFAATVGCNESAQHGAPRLLDFE